MMTEGIMTDDYGAMRAPNLAGVRHWTRDEEFRLLYLRTMRVSRRAIAETLDRSPKAVKTRLELVRSLGFMR
jgi:hypothetical protein